MTKLLLVILTLTLSVTKGKGKIEKVDSNEIDIEEKLIKIIENKKFQKNASYFAFTATPKPKTLEMFASVR